MVFLLMYAPTTSLPDEFTGRRALITGGSRGMGAAIAQRLLDGGATVVTSARSTTEDTPKGSTFIAADLRTEAGARQLVDQAVRASGPVSTPGGIELLQTVADAMGAPLAAFEQTVPLGRFGDPRDIAEAVAFLVSARSQWVTGADLDISGGR